MKRITDHIRDHALAARGVVERAPALAELQRAEWSDEFEGYMRNRLVMGRLRYGPMRGNPLTTPQRVKWMQARLAKYMDTGNIEYLVDVAAVAMVEFFNTTHPAQHFTATDRSEADDDR